MWNGSLTHAVIVLSLAVEVSGCVHFLFLFLGVFRVFNQFTWVQTTPIVFEVDVDKMQALIY